MMRRIDLLPESYVARRRQRRNVGVVVAIGLALLLGLIAWWLFLGFDISDARQQLADAQAQNQQLQAQIDELQRFAELDREVTEKRIALQTVMAGDVNWPGILTEVAMVIPGDTWLTSFQGSAGVTEGAAPVGTETAAVRISRRVPFGRIQFTGNSLSMPGVARWMIRLSSVREFEAVWLNNASRGEEETGAAIVDFDNTIELNQKAASERFLEGPQ